MITVFKNKWKWRDIRPSTVTHTQNLCSTFNPSKVHAHSSEHTHTHTVNTHPVQWAAIYAVVPGEQLGVPCLAQGHFSRGIEGGEIGVHSPFDVVKFIQVTGDDFRWNLQYSITMFLSHMSPWWYPSTTSQQKCEDKVTQFQLPISTKQKITSRGRGANKTLVIGKCNTTDTFPHLCGWQQTS